MSDESVNSDDSDLIVVDAVSEEEPIINVDGKFDQQMETEAPFKTPNEIMETETNHTNNHSPDSEEPLVRIVFRNKNLSDLCFQQFENVIRTHLSRDHNLNTIDSEPCVLEIHPDFSLDNSIPLAEVDDSAPLEIPLYNLSRDSVVRDKKELAEEAKTSTPISLKRGPKCFNCKGEHTVTNCTERLDNRRIQKNKQEMMATSSPQYSARYHSDSSYMNYKPGELSDDLRRALNLRPNQIPFYIYKMRVLGYPPGHLKDTEVVTSGLTMFDSSGKAVNANPDEEGEIDENYSKVHLDPSKLISFPGFNAPLPSFAKDEHQSFGLPPFRDDQMKSFIEKNMKGAMDQANRKRKFQQESPQSKERRIDNNIDNTIVILSDDDDSSQSAVKVASSKKSLQEHEEILIKSSSSTPSPSLSDLELIKLKLQRELESESREIISSLAKENKETKNGEAITDEEEKLPVKDQNSSNDIEEVEILPQNNTEIEEIAAPVKDDSQPTSSSSNGPEIVEINDTADISMEQSADIIECTPEKPKLRKSMSCIDGTPMMYHLSSFSSLPEASKFAEGVSDYVPFENLPDSVGIFDKMRGVLSRVRKSRTSQTQ